MKTTATTLYPFVPAGTNFPQSIKFFEALGFDVAWMDAGLAGLRLGGAYFILQNINVPEWQTNQMITLEVNDLDAFWKELDLQDLSSQFQGVKLKAPSDYAWGREVHIIDPAGVCWHVRQSAT